MKLPSPNSVTGQVLRLMLDGKTRSKLEITDTLGLHPAKEVTARLRDFRKDQSDGYCLDIPQWTENRGGQQVWLYRIELNSTARALIDELRTERERMASAGRAA